MIPASLLAAPGLLAPVLQEATRTHFTLRDAPPAWVIVLLIVPALLIVVGAVYGLERGATRREVVRLAVLRALALACVLAILFRPALETIRYRTQRTVVPVLIDDSASMRRSDAYADDGERAALAKTAGLVAGDSPAGHTRAALVARALSDHLLPQLTEQGYDVRLYRFSSEVSPVASPDDVTGSGDRTRLGEAIALALEENRGRSVPGIVLVSDGRSNDGRDPRDAARMAATELVPIYTVGVGDPSAPSNLAIEIVEAPDVALQNDEVSFTARVTHSGVESDVAQVSLVAEDEEGSTIETLAVQEARIAAGEEPARIVLRFTPLRAGEIRVAVKVAPRPDEALTDDNVVRRTIQVKPEKIRVLYVEGFPRWEFRFLKHSLLRADENLVVHTFLTSADRGAIQDCTKGFAPLARIPTDRRTLLENFDVIILGDVSPDDLGESRDDRDEFMESVRDFVRRGGGFLMIAGELDSPRSYAGTPIEELLPIELPGAEEEALAHADRSIEFLPRLESPSHPHDLVRLVDNPEENRRLWELPNGLRGHYWFAPVKKALPGAEVLLRHPELRNRYGNLVLAAVTYVPEGRSMFLGIDSTWRWRYVYSDTYFDRFWRKVMRYLALNRLKSGDRRYNLAVERSVFELNDRAVLEARVLDEAFQPSVKPRQPAFVKLLRTGKVTQVSLEPVPGEAGAFRAAFPLPEEGRYEAWLTADDTEGGKRVASVEFDARLPDRENRDPMLDATTLRAVAAISAGGTAASAAGATNYFPLSRVGEVARRFRGGGQIDIPEAAEVRDLWDTGWVLAALVGLLAAEWWLRKRSQLL